MEDLVIEFIQSQISVHTPYIHINTLFEYFNISDSDNLSDNEQTIKITETILSLISDGTILLTARVDENNKQSLYISLSMKHNKELQTVVEEGKTELQQKIDDFVEKEEYEKAADYQKLYNDLYGE